MLDKSPNWVPHFLSTDAMKQLGIRTRGQGLSARQFDERTVSHLMRKATEKIDGKLTAKGLAQANADLRAGTQLTSNKPIYKKHIALFDHISRRNKRLAIALDNASTNKQAFDKIMKEQQKYIANLFETDPTLIAQVATDRVAKSIHEGLFQNQVAKMFGRTRSDLMRKRGNVLGYRQLKLPRLKDMKNVPEEIARHIDKLARKTSKLMFPEDVANIMDSMYAGLAGNHADFFNMIHQATNLMKAYLTVPNPAFHGRNLISSLWMAWTDNINPLRDISSFKDALRLHHYLNINDVNKLKSMKIAGYNGEDLYKLLTSHNIIGSHYWDTGQIEEALSVLEKTRSLNPLSPQFMPFQAGRKVMESIEDNIRSAHFIQGLKNGLTPFQSAQNVLKIHYRYNDVTQFEKNILSVLIPFYRWQRFNLPRMIELLAQNPAKILGTKKAIDNAQAILADGEYVDEILLPKWLRENYGVQTTKLKDGKVGVTALGSFFPFADLAKLNTAKDMAEFVFSALSPLIKTPFELALNKDAFFEKEIQRFKGQKMKFLGMNVSPRAYKIVQVIRPLNEMNKLLDVSGKSNVSLTRRILAFTIGLKQYTRDMRREHRFKVKELKKENSDIKYAIRKARQDKDKHEADRLLGLIRDNNRLIRDLNWALNKAMH